MPSAKYLAYDFGAESGRAIVGIVGDGSIALEEVHRFPNRQIRVGGHLHWDLPALFRELKEGLAIAVRKGHDDIASIGIDTWGVDFGLVGPDGRMLGLPYAYRDSRTRGMMERVFGKVTREEIYAATGIQFLPFNSLYQLYAMAEQEPEVLAAAETLLFIPDLFNFLLTGKRVSEYTIASTSQLINAATGAWDETLFSRLDLPLRIMPPVVQPGAVIGTVLPELLRGAGLGRDVNVVAVGCHDTASAVAAVPAKGNHWAYLSSGTWSLLGAELDRPLIAGGGAYTNEGGISGTIRFLRNVMGLWLLQETRRSWARQGEEYTYDQLVAIAHEAGRRGEAACRVDPDDPSFLNPPEMPDAILAYCRERGLKVPGSKGELLRCILESLAAKYSLVLRDIIKLTGREVNDLHVVGGGSQNRMLDQLTADACGVTVLAGPVEATALGNIMMQAIASGQIGSVEEGRSMIACSFPVQSYSPSR